MVGTLDNVKRLVRDKVEESINLEYKESLPSNERIAKEICAFANTVGGTIIFGVKEKNRVPLEVSWVTNESVEEKIQSILNTSVRPNIENVNVLPLENPEDNWKCVIVVDVPKSLKGPHMTNNRYFKRAGSTSRPMEDDEVKKAMFESGLRTALCSEIENNLQLAKKALDLIEGIYRITDPEKRKPIALTPFLTDAWKVAVSSGLLSTLNEEDITQLIEAYRLIHEVNSLIEWLKVDKVPIVHSTIDMSSVPSGTYVPALLQTQIRKLTGVLNNLGAALDLW